ncbi:MULTISPECIES: N-6 DNA methylase [Alphaproteobacteria]|uniref:Eco57I restriction-modification methylase domain-containing protein n=1 Tax=Alphaproteobacteria TaxID=28211 RepID=UPI0032999350
MKVVTREAQLLKSTTIVVDDFVRSYKGKQQEARFQLLEAAASRFGGFDLALYHRAFKIKPVVGRDVLLAAARNVVANIEASGIPPALAVSALTREALDDAAQRQSGAYHTDFRLAQHLASSVAPALKPGSKVIDPACGAGILLAAVTIVACGADRRLTSEWLSNCVFAADLSLNALRGTQIALACLTDDVTALKKMRANWRVQDSLLAGLAEWTKVAQKGFDVVVANPPWEKIKITRHEFIRAEGMHRHYGAIYDSFDAQKYESRKAEVESYGVELALRYPTLRSGEPDFYVAFTELLFNLAKRGGSIGLLLPAGLIRSQNTQFLREHLFDQSSALSFQILENRARFFEIDTRFKFLLVQARKRVGEARQKPIELSHGYGTPMGLESTPRVRVGRSALSRLRPDLTIPEVKSEAEWHLFSRMMEHGIEWSRTSSPWHPNFMREVDMTRDRKVFLDRKQGRGLPLVEGRMVHQHRFGAKSYAGGTGRSAWWSVNVPGASCVQPQFWVNPRDLTSRTAHRVKIPRAGFCDITGQTNERSCLAAMIPAGVVCGNKVPTIIFPNDPAEERLWLWIALANSLPFDWMMRRVITTTINYFHLLSLRLPPIEPDSLPGRQLVAIARELDVLDRSGGSPKVHWQIAELRAKADQLVLNAYGLTMADLDLMMEDFPLIDRAQPSLKGEGKSTITRDLIGAHGRSKASSASRARVNSAASLGALPYMPSQMASASDSQTVREAHGQ